MNDILNVLFEKAKRILEDDMKIDDDRVLDIVESIVFEMPDIDKYSIKTRKEIVSKLFNRFRRYGELQPLLDDDSISEIMINGYDNIFIERGGKILSSDISFESRERLENIIQKIVADVDRKVNRSSPIVDARLKDGSRVHVVLPPIAIDGAVVTIRKFTCATFSMMDLVKSNALNNDMAEYLYTAVREKKNILICGGTGSGKTTFLNILSDAIPKDERIITIEDSAELQINGIDNLIRMETKDKTTHDGTQISIRDLIRAALRMRPDRIIVGEVRGEEALDMLQAMNTGHKGSLTSAHSNSARDMIYRLETMILSGNIELPLYAIRTQIARGIDIVVYMKRFSDGIRRVVSIDELNNELKDTDIELVPVYSYCDDSGEFKCLK